MSLVGYLGHHAMLLVAQRHGSWVVSIVLSSQVRGQWALTLKCMSLLGIETLYLWGATKVYSSSCNVLENTEQQLKEGASHVC